MDFCASKGIHCTAYSPLGSTDSPLLKDETIAKIAEKRNVSPAQVVISWGAARGSVLPKSVTPSVSQHFCDCLDKSVNNFSPICSVSRATSN